MAAIVYSLCALTAALCAFLLLQAHVRSGYRLLLWSGLCFACLTLNNLLLVLDKLVISSVDLSPYDATVATILVALAQRDTGNRSLAFADGLVEELGKVAPLMPRPRRFAGFAVLTSPDTPSVLVELGLLSNRDDARALADPGHRARLAGAIHRALDRYFASLQR